MVRCVNVAECISIQAVEIFLSIAPTVLVMLVKRRGGTREIATNSLQLAQTKMQVSKYAAWLLGAVHRRRGDRCGNGKQAKCKTS